MDRYNKPRDDFNLSVSSGAMPQRLSPQRAPADHHAKHRKNNSLSKFWRFSKQTTMGERYDDQPDQFYEAH